MNNKPEIQAKPEVAVFLAAYNGLPFIEKQLESILGQTGVTVSVVISVDKSDDNTYEWCLEQARGNPKIIILPYGERFGGAAKNFYRIIIENPVTDFDYVALSDQDDIWNPDKLSRAIGMMTTNNSVAYSSNVTAFWPDGSQKLVRKAYPPRKFDYLFEGGGPGCTFVLEKPIFDKFQAFLTANRDKCDDIFAHDWLIYAFCRRNDASWYMDTATTMLYRQHGSNLVGANSGIGAYLKRLSMIKNDWYREEVAKLAALFDDRPKGRIWRLRHFRELRRKPSDAYAFFCLDLLGIF